MKVAILGAGGALGMRIVEAFQLGEGPSMTAVDREASQLASAARFPIDLRVADVFDVTSLAGSFTGCSAAVHVLTVETSALKRSISAFCRAAAQARVRRLIYISTTDVYGVPPRPGTNASSSIHTRHESERINALAAADRQFSAECRELGVAGVVLRPGVIYGPRAEWFGAIVRDLQHDRAWLTHAGNGICNCVYIDHVVDAIRLVLKTRTLAGPAFILTDDEPLTWRRLYEAIATELDLPLPRLLGGTGAKPEVASATAESSAGPVSSETRARQGNAWKFASEHAAKALGLPPPIPFAEAIRRSAAWWRFTQGDLIVT